MSSDNHNAIKHRFEYPPISGIKAVPVDQFSLIRKLGGKSIISHANYDEEVFRQHCKNYEIIANSVACEIFPQVSVKVQVTGFMVAYKDTSQPCWMSYSLALFFENDEDLIKFKLMYDINLIVSPTE